MKKFALTALTLILGVTLFAANGTSASFDAFKFWGNKVETLTPVNGRVEIPVADISDGKAHHFKVKADDGIMVTFFTLKSADGVIRAAVDACDVCYRSGKGYVQSGDYMVCTNCGQKFASNKINVLKGGCNPAPLNRKIEGDKLVIAMSDITANSWYCRYKK